MKYRDPLIVLFAALLFGLSTPSPAATADQEAAQAAEAKAQAQLEADYRKALAEVEKERLKAEASMEKARKQMQLAAEVRAKSSEESEKARAAHSAEMARMHEELNLARRQLRETSREIARVDREVARARAGSGTNSFVYRTTARPVIGVVLGNANDEGVEVLGVSPAGPAERAGIQQGDVIVAFGNRKLSAVDESGDAMRGLNIALKDLKADEPVIVSVDRGGESLDLSVVPEKREPLGWHTVTRFPTAPESPESPEKVISIERIVVPEIDTEELAEQIEQIRIEVAERGKLISAREPASHDVYEFEFHDLSELGDLALHEANIWFGLPLTRGLKLAELDPELGEYFKVDRGVLVLKAQTDNKLQLETGDVILQVGDTQVNSPAEFMRTLREYESGEELSIDVKRDRKNRTLKVTMPERHISFSPLKSARRHSVRIDRHAD